jgi:hypothetical protein
VKISLLVLLLCLAFTSVNAQGKKNNISKKIDTTSQRHVYTAVEELPEPEGGNEKLVATISKYLKPPLSCGTPMGRIVISFIVEADGKIDGYKVIRDPCGENHPLANAMFKAVNTLKWKPGKMNGKPVAVRYTFPIACLMPSYD